MPGGLETVAELLRERIDLERGHGVSPYPRHPRDPLAVPCAAVPIWGSTARERG